MLTVKVGSSGTTGEEDSSGLSAWAVPAKMAAETAAAAALNFMVQYRQTGKLEAKRLRGAQRKLAQKIYEGCQLVPKPGLEKWLLSQW